MLWNVDKPYKSLVGSLRTEAKGVALISYCVGVLSQVMAGPSKKQWDMGLDVVQYLKGAKDLGLTYKQHKDYKDMCVIVHADSDFANDKVSGKSIYGYVVYVGGNAITWKSKKAQSTATSTTIAELDAIYHCGTECKWIGEFLVSLGVKKDATFHIYSDNQSAVKVLKGEKYLDCTKHETVKIEYLRDLIKGCLLMVERIGTGNC
jgi:hypothetical protein